MYVCMYTVHMYNLMRVLIDGHPHPQIERLKKELAAAQATPKKGAEKKADKTEKEVGSDGACVRTNCFLH